MKNIQTKKLEREAQSVTIQIKNEVMKGGLN
jgi:hypothetical protein